MEWLTILAIIAGPVLAVQAQKWIERRREQRGRKLWLFRELMATRGTRLSQRHVEALNTIDLEYDASNKSQRKVHEAWRSYFDTLNTAFDPQNPHPILETRDRAFVDLMYEMGNYLGFTFDRVAIQRNCYTPVGHGEVEADLQLIRKGIAELLTGKRALSTISFLEPGRAPLQIAELQPAVAPIAAAPEPPQQQQPLEAAPDVQVK